MCDSRLGASARSRGGRRGHRRAGRGQLRGRLGSGRAGRGHRLRCGLPQLAVGGARREHQQAGARPPASGTELAARGAANGDRAGSGFAAASRD